MVTASANSLVRLPSFSIILETENLANADIKGLFKSLVSLVHQDLPPTRANEVLLIDTGDTPKQLLKQIHELYPWVTVVTAPGKMGYYEAKMLGAEMATGEAVVYTDSDCIYEPTWLQRILSSFIQGDNIQVVSGETATLNKGIYGTAMALTYIFPPFSSQKALIPTEQYYLNNVAFRREFLLKYPIPVDLPLYRGNCVIHAHKLRDTGCTIWRQPLARATHAPPNGFSHFFWRFLLIGYDYYWQLQYLGKDAKPEQVYKTQGKLEILGDRISKIFAGQPQRLLHLPLAIPIALFSLFCIFVGYLITKAKPNFLLKQYQRILGEI